MKKFYLVILILSNISFGFAQDKQTLKEVNTMLELIEKGMASLHKKEMASWSADMIAIQESNVHRIDSLLSRHGWLIPPQVSKKASRAYYEVLLYAPLELQKRYQNEVFTAAKNKAIKSGEYYTFADGIRTQENKYQIFGTQAKTDDMGNLYFIPIDTTLINNRKLPILPPGEYIYFSNPKFVTLFIHIYSAQKKDGVADAQIYLNDNKIGQSNSRGFFQINLPRFRNKIELHIRKGTISKTITLDNSKNQDWIDQVVYF